MPELPEVEVICRGIRPHLVGRRVIAIHESGKKLRQPIPIERLNLELVGRRVTAVTRRAKYLEIEFETGTMLLIHLGMTGNLGFFSPTAAPAKHDHLCLSLDNHSELRFNDSRRFGSIQILSAAQTPGREATIFSTTGPEPFSPAFTADYLFQLAKGRDLPVKTFIMTNQVVAGIGNIYANESLFRAAVHPARKVRTLAKKQWHRLIVEIREVLEQAIACGGSTISDFINAGREKGYFQVNFRVYGREGEACPTCAAATIKKIKLGGRASYYCPKCQN
jgi:formamidopyrimidine-DNA glycosylase